MVSFRLPDKRRGTLSGGTDGRVPFVLPPRCPASAMQPAGMVGNGRRDGTARAPRCKRKTVKSLSPTLGIAGESPQHSEDLQGKARPEGERPHSKEIITSHSSQAAAHYPAEIARILYIMYRKHPRSPSAPPTCSPPFPAFSPPVCPCVRYKPQRSAPR